MKTIVVAATKGGVGKSTLCYNLAIEATQKHQVLVADLDPQRSVRDMMDRRMAAMPSNNPRLISNVQSLGQSVKLLIEAGYDREFLFVDTPGSMMTIIRDAVSAADVVVLPVKPSPMDWRAQEAMADLIESLGLRNRLLVVVNEAEGKSDLSERTKEFFAMRTVHPIHIIKKRDDYRKGVETGQSGFEVSRNREIGTEMKKLWAGIQEALNVATTKEQTLKETPHDQRIH